MSGPGVRNVQVARGESLTAGTVLVVVDVSSEAVFQSACIPSERELM